ncbi:hypothetical protein CHKEEEPN_4674 [Methylorubrum podarium]|nr:hypothetical protein CHKEEEPN_4674 [Methylorubrum podarium]
MTSLIAFRAGRQFRNALNKKYRLWICCNGGLPRRLSRLCPTCGRIGPAGRACGDVQQARAAPRQGRRRRLHRDIGAARRPGCPRRQRPAEGPAEHRDREPRQPRLRQLHDPRHLLTGLLQSGGAGLCRRRAAGLGQPRAGPVRREPGRAAAGSAGHALRDERLRRRPQHLHREAALQSCRRVRHGRRPAVRDRYRHHQRARPRDPVPRSRFQGTLLRRPDPRHRPQPRRHRLVERAQRPGRPALRAGGRRLRREPLRLPRLAALARGDLHPRFGREGARLPLLRHPVPLQLPRPRGDDGWPDDELPAERRHLLQRNLVPGRRSQPAHLRALLPGELPDPLSGIPRGLRRGRPVQGRRGGRVLRQPVHPPRLGHPQRRGGEQRRRVRRGQLRADRPARPHRRRPSRLRLVLDPLQRRRLRLQLQQRRRLHELPAEDLAGLPSRSDDADLRPRLRGLQAGRLQPHGREPARCRRLQARAGLELRGRRAHRHAGRHGDGFGRLLPDRIHQPADLRRPGRLPGPAQRRGGHEHRRRGRADPAAHRPADPERAGGARPLRVLRLH